MLSHLLSKLDDSGCNQLTTVRALVDFVHYKGFDYFTTRSKRALLKGVHASRDPADRQVATASRPAKGRLDRSESRMLLLLILEVRQRRQRVLRKVFNRILSELPR